MTYIKNLLNSIKHIFILYIIQFTVIIIVSYTYYLFNGYDNLNNFIKNQLSIFSMILYIIYIIIILKLYKYPNTKIKKQLYFPLIILGISISCFLNMIIFKISPPTSNKELVPISLSILGTGIIGPILEELLFRYALLNKLKEFNKDKQSIILSTLIFALIHINPIKIFYTIILGFILNIIYHKTKNIKSSILIHISANITSIFIFEYNIYILLLSFINLIISGLIIKKIIIDK